MSVKVRVAFPLLRMENCIRVTPGAKSRLLGLSVMMRVAGAVPVPVAGMLLGPLVASLSTVTVPL